MPILKTNASAYSKSVSVDDFRGISITCSSVVSKVFEHCILDRYGYFISSSDNQFGFKKKSSCTHAVFTLRSVADYYVNHGSTVNTCICALDISKAFDKMNHHGLFLKYMQKRIPLNLLCILENWFKLCSTCIKWGSVVSRIFSVDCGVRQGGVLSPYLFALYVDSIIDRVKDSRIGCYLKGVY